MVLSIPVLGDSAKNGDETQGGARLREEDPGGRSRVRVDEDGTGEERG
jgi:hypothetical protein